MLYSRFALALNLVRKWFCKTKGIKQGTLTYVVSIPGSASTRSDGFNLNLSGLSGLTLGFTGFLLVDCCWRLPSTVDRSVLDLVVDCAQSFDRERGSTSSLPGLCIDFSFSVPSSGNLLIPFEICKGINGLGKVVLRESRGSSTEVYLYGGHVISWKNDHGEELLFVSSKETVKKGSVWRKFYLVVKFY